MQHRESSRRDGKRPNLSAAFPEWFRLDVGVIDSFEVCNKSESAEDDPHSLAPFPRRISPHADPESVWQGVSSNDTIDKPRDHHISANVRVLRLAVAVVVIKISEKTSGIPLAGSSLRFLLVE